MKKVTIALLCICAGMSVHAQEKSSPVLSTIQAPAATNEDAGKFKFKEKTHDYGEVPEGPAAEYDFVFKNVGRQPIVIKEAHGSCGCTVPQWPREPIMPGKKGTIHVSYNTSGRPGNIQKDVIITSDAAQSPMVLHIKGTVAAKKTEATAAVSPAQHN
jgi:hypothetical protein